MNTEIPTKITVTLPTNAYFISGIRDFTLNIIKNTTNFNEKWAFRFQSVVDELCNNAIEYGSSPGSEIRVTFNYLQNQYLQISVEDTGTGTNKITAKEIEELYAKRRDPDYIFDGIRGRGLAKIIGAWSDQLTFQDRPDGGLKITVTKHLSREQTETGREPSKLTFNQQS